MITAAHQKSSLAKKKRTFLKQVMKVVQEACAGLRQTTQEDLES